MNLSDKTKVSKLATTPRAISTVLTEERAVVNHIPVVPYAARLLWIHVTTRERRNSVSDEVPSDVVFAHESAPVQVIQMKSKRPVWIKDQLLASLPTSLYVSIQYGKGNERTWSVQKSLTSKCSFGSFML